MVFSTCCIFCLFSQDKHSTFFSHCPPYPMHVHPSIQVYIVVTFFYSISLSHSHTHTLSLLLSHSIDLSAYLSLRILLTWTEVDEINVPMRCLLHNTRNWDVNCTILYQQEKVFVLQSNSNFHTKSYRTFVVSKVCWSMHNCIIRRN